MWLFILEGMSNSTDIWNTVNGLGQQGYEGAPGSSASHQSQLGSYSGLQLAHGNLVSFPSPALNVDTKIPVLLMCICNLLRTFLLIRCWRLTWTGVSRRCPPFTATTRCLALPQTTPQRTQQVKMLTKTFLFFYYLWHADCNAEIMVFFVSVSGSHVNVSGASQTGDTLGKALASVSMLCSNRSGQRIKPKP